MSKTLYRTSIPATFTLDPANKPLVADGRMVAPTAYAYPPEPPRDWFARRRYTKATPVEVTKAGQIFGHVWEWNVPHIGMIDGTLRKVYAPRNRTGYRAYLNKHVLCDDGTQVRTGVIYIDTDHADLTLSGQQAQMAMAHTGTAVADVCIFEDEFGGQIAGALRPHVTPAQVRVFRGSDISPDWRKESRGGPHEMFGMISVNTSGFVVPATIAASGEMEAPRKVADGKVKIRWDFEDDEPLALVAVGMVRHQAPDPIAELAAEIRDIHEFLADAKADKVMARIAPHVEAMTARADAVMARIS